MNVKCFLWQRFLAFDENTLGKIQNILKRIEDNALKA
jgi:hypothetical protein